MGILGDSNCGCGSKIVLGLGESLWCAGGCSWRCGSGLDLIASRLGGYDKACAVAAQLEPWMATDREIPKKEKAQRDIAEFLWESTTPPATMEHISARESFYSNYRMKISGAMHLNRKQVSHLTLLLLEADVVAPLGMHGTAGSIIAYWATAHRVAFLVFIPTGGRTEMRLDVSPTRYAWSNLHQANRNARSADVYSTFQAMGPFQEVYHTTLTDRVPVSTICSTLYNDPAVAWDDLRFCCKGDDWHSYLPAWSHVPGFEGSGFMEHPMEEVASLNQLVDTLLQKDAAKAVNTLEGMKMSEGFRTQLLLRHRNSETGRLMDEKLSRVLMEIDEGVGIYHTPSGYETGRGESINSISNFTIQLHRIIGFDRTSELAYDMSVVRGEDDLRLILPGKAMETGTALETAIRAQQIGAGASNMVSVIHTKDMGRVMRILRLSAAKIPRVRGFKTLGWTTRHDAFVLPNRVISAAAVAPCVYSPPLDSDFHPFMQMPESVSTGGTIGPQTAELVSGLVGSFLRGFYGRGMSLVAIQNNEKHRGLLLDLFRELGQTQPLRLTSVIQKHLDAIRGYPVLVQNLSEQQGRNVKLCGARLAEQGRSLDEGGTEAGILLREILEEVSGELLRGADTGYQERRSVSVENSMALEGQEVLRRFRADWPQAGERWRAVDQFLETKEKEIERFAKVRFADDTVVFPLELLEGVDIDDLTIELGLLCRDVRVEEKQLLVGRNSLFPVFEDFYGEAPRLAMISA